MDNAQPQPPVDTENELAVLEETVRGLQVPTHAAELIADALNFLADHGAGHQVAVLDDVYTAASQMLTTAQKLDQGFRASLAIAKTLRQQREDTRRALADLQRAIEECDVENPDIEALAESIREEQDEMLWYALDDMLAENIAENSPLTYTESWELMNMLTYGSNFDQGHYLWDELRDWIRRAEEFNRTGLTPPSAASNE